MASSESVKGFLKRDLEATYIRINEQVVVQVCSKGTPMTGPVVIERAEYFYDEMNIIDKCIFSGG
jgi:hypothetical protein